MTRMPRNIAASVRQKLLNVAHTRGEQLELVLTQFALERLLARLAAGTHADDFILKGALLFVIWTRDPHRATRDLDLLGRRTVEPATLGGIFRDLCAVSMPEDGLVLDADSVRVGRIREDQEYGGLRVEFTAHLDSARIALQVDVGFGDAVVPRPTVIKFPSLLDFPPTAFKAYPREAVLAEKLHAMVVLGMANSRMKDFYDAWTLARLFGFDGSTLGKSIAATFRRRRTEVPAAVPIALTDEFPSDPAKQAQWRAFVRRGRLSSKEISLGDVVEVLRTFFLPILTAIRERREAPMTWSAGGPWREGATGA